MISRGNGIKDQKGKGGRYGGGECGNTRFILGHERTLNAWFRIMGIIDTTLMLQITISLK